MAVQLDIDSPVIALAARPATYLSTPHLKLAERLALLGEQAVATSCRSTVLSPFERREDVRVCPAAGMRLTVRVALAAARLTTGLERLHGVQ